MNVSRVVAQTLGLLTAAALSTGCSEASPPSSFAPPSAPNSARNGVSSRAMGGIEAFAGVGPHGPAHPNRHDSWISPDAKREHRLLFASDSGLDEVDIYSLPSV